MTLSRDPGAYKDIEAIFEAALDRAPETSHFKAKNPIGKFTPGAGISWMQRANRFKSLSRQAGNGRYDDLTLIRRCECRGKECAAQPGNCVGHIIEITTVPQLRGVLETQDGTPVEVKIGKPTKPPKEIDEAYNAMLAAREQLKREGS